MKLDISRYNLARFIASIFSVFLASCAAAPKIVINSPEQKPPLEIEIPQAFSSEGKLRIRAIVKPLVNLKADQVSIGVVGVSTTGRGAEQFKLLSDLIGDSVASAGKQFVADFILDSAGLTEYKVIGRWGSEVTPTVKKSANSEVSQTEILLPKQPALVTAAPERSGEIKLIDLVLHRTALNCRTPPCEELCSFDAKLENGTDTQLSKVTLALGIRFVAKGKGTLVPAALAPIESDEQEVELSGFEVSPGQTKALEVKIDQPLLDLPDGTFVPHLRLLRVN